MIVMKVRNMFPIAMLMMSCLLSNAQTSFVNGADISWVTEMEADGKTFYNYSGDETDFFALMKECGMGAVRFRVWVEPNSSDTDENYAYGYAWCDKADVVAKSKRAVAAGLDVMIDFHYSDIFADPSRQSKPVKWRNFSFDELKTAVADHTKDVLEALKAEGVSPRWVQIGNETRNGMLWPAGQLWTETGDIADGWKNFTELYMAGYNAAKNIFSESIVMPHIDNAYADNDWWFEKFRQNGAKMDMIALSHYPQSYEESAYSINDKAVNNVKSLAAKYGVKVMIAEVGVKTNDNPEEAKAVLDDFYGKIKDLSECAGVFYWEPQLYGWWKPKAYDSLGWGAYNMGAFWDDGRPSAVLDCFKNNPTVGLGINDIPYVDNNRHDIAIYTVSGRRIPVGRLSVLDSGLYIINNKKVVVR